MSEIPFCSCNFDMGISYTLIFLSESIVKAGSQAAISTVQFSTAIVLNPEPQFTNQWI